MKQDEIFGEICRYVITNILTFEEYRSMSVEKFRQFVKEHYEPIPKSELEVGKEYNGSCRNSFKAVWNGDVFTYESYKLNFKQMAKINHYEDDNGFDLFIPIKEK